MSSLGKVIDNIRVGADYLDQWPVVAERIFGKVYEVPEKLVDEPTLLKLASSDCMYGGTEKQLKEHRSQRRLLSKYFGDIYHPSLYFSDVSASKIWCLTRKLEVVADVGLVFSPEVVVPFLRGREVEEDVRTFCCGYEDLGSEVVQAVLEMIADNPELKRDIESFFQGSMSMFLETGLIPDSADGNFCIIREGGDLRARYLDSFFPLNFVMHPSKTKEVNWNYDEAGNARLLQFLYWMDILHGKCAVPYPKELSSRSHI